jgi:hypothetical protein
VRHHAHIVFITSKKFPFSYLRNRQMTLLFISLHDGQNSKMHASHAFHIYGKGNNMRMKRHNAYMIANNMGLVYCNSTKLWKNPGNSYCVNL